jgi:hypothetical protein
MTQLLSSRPVIRPPADRCCDRAPCFQAWLETTAGPRQTRVITELCACHLGEAAQALAAWARAQGLSGQLTVLAIGQPPLRQPADPTDQFTTGFAFGAIQIGA